jgi:methylated-DNA-[protein]-cysteine S-methyltransferase
VKSPIIVIVTMIIQLGFSSSRQMTHHFCYWQSPFGKLRLIANEHYFLRLELPVHAQKPLPHHFIELATLLPNVINQLNEYFTGIRQSFDFEEFDLPCLWQGTAFQQAVWQSLLHIPYGQTCSYGELAQQIKRPRAVRAVGAANGANPFPIIAACHRVIASTGKLHGYGGGLELKRQLLALEANHCA